MKKGFTLIELLIVISIIGILAVALLPNILSAPATARDAGRKTAANSVIAALEQYKSANGSYPAVAANGCIPTSLATFFKGGVLPTGANSKGTTDAALGCNKTYTAGAYAALAAGNPTAVAYCPLTADTSGYSYIVAIRMENVMTGSATGNNVLKPAGANETGLAACPTAYTVATVNALASETSNWYYVVQ